MVKNLLEVQEAQVWPLSWEDPLEKETATHSSSCMENPMDKGAWLATFPGVAKSCVWLRNQYLLLSMHYNKRYERGNLELFFSGRGRAGHRLGGRGRIEGFLEKVVGKWLWKGNKDLCRWRFGWFQGESVAYVKAPTGGLMGWEVLVVSRSLAIVCGEE